jgi:hypothetical protein
VTTRELIGTVCPTIGTLGAAYYFTPPTLARGRALGLDGFRFYFLGRGGVLGDVEAPVVASAFGYFEPSLVEAVWDSARARADPRAAGREHLAAAHDFGRDHFSAVGELEAFCAAARSVVQAADPAGLALFAGVAAEPLPEDPPARAMQLLAVLRELRGSAHLLAVVASGISPRVAHYLRRPNDFALFGWKEDDVPQVTRKDRERLAASEHLTDDLVLGPYSALDADGRSSLIAGLERMEAAIALGQP